MATSAPGDDGDEEKIVRSISRAYGIPYASRENGRLPAKTGQEELKDLVSERFARENSIFPLSIANGILAVAISDPENVLLLDNLKRVTRLNIQPFIASRTQIRNAIDDFY